MKVSERAYMKLWDFAAKLVDEAEGNILDAYGGTSAEPSLRRTYNGKRGRLKALRTEALGTPKRKDKTASKVSDYEPGAPR